MSAHYIFWDYLCWLGWGIASVTVSLASIALIIFIVHEIWNVPEPSKRKEKHND